MRRNVNEPFRLALAFVSALVATIVGFVAGQAVMTPPEPDRPMPCSRGEVYVWYEYPDEALCLARSDR